MAQIGTLSKIYQVVGLHSATTTADRLYYAALIRELDTQLVHVTSSCHNHSATFEWMRDRNLNIINVTRTKRQIIPYIHHGNAYYALYTAYPCDFWFSTKALAVEFKLRF